MASSTLRYLGCVFFMIAAAACSAPEEEESEASDDAFSEAPSQVASGKAPVVFEIDTSTPRLKEILQRDWQSAQVDVLQKIDLTPKAWIKANKDETPSFEVHYEQDESDEETKKNGDCRIKIGLKKFFVKCSYQLGG